MHRFMSSVSAPNISGTSVRIVVPPAPTSMSENGADGGVGCDAGESVGSAAFHANDEFAAS